MFASVTKMRAAGLACLGLIGLTALGGCDQRGFSGLEAEWDRKRSGPYHVVSVSHERAVVSALGRQVAIEPSEGFCLAQESLDTTRSSAFALIGDCAFEAPNTGARRSARGELQLPPSVPGIITVSVSGDPEIPNSNPDKALNGLSEFLESAKGRSMLGRSGDGSSVTLVESRRIGNGVYVLVDDRNSGALPVLERKFWRAFVELNDRLAVVTVSGFKDRPLGKE